MPVPSSISDLSTTPGLNSPAGTESPNTADDYLRTYAAFIKQTNDDAGAAADIASAAVPSATLAAASGSSLVGFQQSGAGTVPRTAQDKNRERVSAEDFGASGGGVANSAASLNSAASQSSVLLNDGVYLLDSVVTMATPTSLTGNGPRTTIKASSTFPTGPILTLAPASGSAAGRRPAARR